MQLVTFTDLAKEPTVTAVDGDVEAVALAALRGVKPDVKLLVGQDAGGVLFAVVPHKTRNTVWLFGGDGSTGLYRILKYQDKGPDCEGNDYVLLNHSALSQP